MGIKIKEVIKEPIIGKIITKIMKTNRMQTMKMKDETDKHQTKEKDKIMRIKHQKNSNLTHKSKLCKNK